MEPPPTPSPPSSSFSFQIPSPPSAADALAALYQEDWEALPPPPP